MYSFKILRTKVELKRVLAMDLRNERLTPKKVDINTKTSLKEAEEHRSEDYKTLKVSENKRLAAFERLSQVSGLWDDLKIVLKNGLPKNFNSLFYSIICGIFAQSLLLALRNIYLLTHMVTAMMKGDKSMFWRSFWFAFGTSATTHVLFVGFL